MWFVHRSTYELSGKHHKRTYWWRYKSVWGVSQMRRLNSFTVLLERNIDKQIMDRKLRCWIYDKESDKIIYIPKNTHITMKSKANLILDNPNIIYFAVLMDVNIWWIKTMDQKNGEMLLGKISSRNCGLLFW